MTFDPTSWPGGAGSSGAPQVLGPFTVAFDQPGATVVLWHAAAGDLILDLWVIATTTWSANTGVEIYCDALDFVNPRKDAANAMTAGGDATRYTTAYKTQLAIHGPSGLDTTTTPSLMRTAADVICDVIGSPSAGVAQIGALVVEAA